MARNIGAANEKQPVGVADSECISAWISTGIKATELA